MNRRFVGVCSWLLVGALAGPVAADDGWSLSSLNPFAAKPSTSKSKTPTRKISDSKSSSNWSLNPFASKPTNSGSSAAKSASSRRKQEPGMLTKTWEALTPWDDHPPKKPAPLVDPRTAKNKKKEKGWFDSWFEEEEPKRPRTVNEWLDQEKPQF